LFFDFNLFFFYILQTNLLSKYLFVYTPSVHKKKLEKKLEKLRGGGVLLIKIF